MPERFSTVECRRRWRFASISAWKTYILTYQIQELRTCRLQIRQRKFKAYQRVHEFEWRGLVDETVRGLFDEVWRETQDNDKWPDSDCLLLALATVINRAVFDDSKCELLAYGPLTLGAMIYRYVVAALH